MSVKLVNEIYEEIKLRNSTVNARSIPDSDEFINFMSASSGVPTQLVKQIIRLLIAAKKIFTMEIVAQDKIRETPSIQGYVISDVSVIRELKNYFQNELVGMYNQQFNKDLMVHQAIKAIFPIIKSLNNTPIGLVANKAIMLEEYNRLMDKHFSDYTEEMKKKLLEAELKRANFKEEGKEDEKEAEKEKAVKEQKEKAVAVDKGKAGKGYERAVDASQYQDFMLKSKNHPVSRIINIYGIKFFFQVYLRKYQFSYIKDLVSRGQIKKRDDLLLLKEMLRKIKMNASRDPGLRKYTDTIYELERAISHHIYFSQRGGGKQKW